MRIHLNAEKLKTMIMKKVSHSKNNIKTRWNIKTGVIKPIVELQERSEHFCDLSLISAFDEEILD